MSHTSTPCVRAGVCVTALVLAGAAGAEPPTRYRMAELPGLAEPAPWPFAVNKRGVIAGRANRTNQGTLEEVRERPVRWDNGVLTELPGIPGALAMNNQVRAISDSGIMVGIHAYPGCEVWAFHAAAWIGGQPVSLGALPGHAQSFALAVNDSGLVVGHSGNFYFDASAVRWVNSVIQTLPGLPGFPVANAAGVNNAGTATGAALMWDEFSLFVVDSRALAWDPSGQVRILPARPGDAAAEARAINNAGQVAGHSGPVEEFIIDPMFPPLVTVIPHAVVWKNGQPVTLPELPGDTASAAWDINDAGTVIGGSGGLDLAKTFSFVYRPTVWVGGRAVDFNASIDPATPGWEAAYLTDINNSGVVVGFGNLNGRPAAFVATPVNRG